jgi:phenylalanyl-tRNA synthetase beta chain
MNIKILDSWLRDYLKTKATAHDIAKAMSLSSISIERVEPYKDDFVFDIEVTTNRPDLMSVTGLAREAAAILPQFGFTATFTPPKFIEPTKPQEKVPLEIINDRRLVGRICAVVMQVEVKKSNPIITERLESSDIRSLNNIIDITNYIMRTIGHPAHVFDYDRLPNQTIRVRESKKGEMITTLDNKTYALPGGDIVADDGKGNIIDLLGIMGLENSVVTDDTKRIVLFIDNNDRYKMRKTSMTLGIRTEAVQMNEKGIDPELALDALLFGIELYQKEANGTLLSPIIDIQENPYKEKSLVINEQKIQQIMGVPLKVKEAASILEKLGFHVITKGEEIKAVVPSNRADDMNIPEDLIEEVARVYGYHNLPDILPPVTTMEILPFASNPFFWESRAKEALKYWGFTEVYTYPMVSEEMYEGPTDDAVKLANPLGEDFVYMRRTLVPSLLKVVQDNKQYNSISIFEIANVYEKDGTKLPIETRMLGGLIKKQNANFFEIKGILEQLAYDFGIKNLHFSAMGTSSLETEIKVGKEIIGSIEILDETLVNFELNFERLIHHATLNKTYKPLAKYPPIIEDISLVVDESIPTGDIIKTIKDESPLISEVSLLDKYQNSRTFHILYQHANKNLTTEDVSEIRKSLLKNLKVRYKAEVK